jgi:hypothetical protein
MFNRKYTPKVNIMNIGSLENQKVNEIVDQDQEEDEVTILLGDLSISSISNSPHSSRTPSPFPSRNPSPIQTSSLPSTSKSNQFAYSKFCQAFVTDGECTQSGCTYAHSLSQFSPVRCNFGERCRNLHNRMNPHRECGFIHPQESKEQFMHRVKMVVPENIKMAEVLEQQKKLSTEQKKKKEVEMIYPVVTIYSHPATLPEKISFVMKNNITDFQVKILTNSDQDEKMVWNMEEEYFRRLVQNPSIDFLTRFYLEKSIIYQDKHITGPVNGQMILSIQGSLKNEFKVSKIEDNFIFLEA